jgi:hypothetical protein
VSFTDLLAFTAAVTLALVVAALFLTGNINLGG